MVKKYLFLDDIRHPYDVFIYTKETIYIQQKWLIVKSHDEFIRWITKNGLPYFISFDHDLESSHYISLKDYDINIKNTGFDSAKWLVQYCVQNNLKCPEYFCHSKNIEGKERINLLLNKFKNSC